MPRGDASGARLGASVSLASAGSDMNQSTRYRRGDVQNRQIDTLIGLCKGITADNRVNQQEAEFLEAWLNANRLTIANNPVTLPLYLQVKSLLEDGVLDDIEAEDLLATLHSFSNNEGLVDGEFIQSSNLPIDHPPPQVTFPGKRFAFTGTFAYGSRSNCERAVLRRDGICIRNVRQDLDYLVLGRYVTPGWVHESWGRKIEKAVAYREQGLSIAIIGELHWRQQGQIND